MEVERGLALLLYKDNYCNIHEKSAEKEPKDRKIYHRDGCAGAIPLLPMACSSWSQQHRHECIGNEEKVSDGI